MYLFKNVKLYIETYKLLYDALECIVKQSRVLTQHFASLWVAILIPQAFVASSHLQLPFLLLL